MGSLAVLDPRAAFVDVGSEKMHVSIAGGPPVVFGTVTSQLHALRDYLAVHQVRSVAMEATGVYWLPLYGVLEAAGLEVVMVDGRQTRNLPGRKTDMKDCQWGATLHAHGLLRAGFVPPAHVRRLQDYLRLRGDHIAAAAGHVQHMQKALERMNVKLHEVISSLTGASGQAVIRAVLAGERDPQVLLGLCDVQIRKAKAERVVESLPKSTCSLSGRPFEAGTIIRTSSPLAIARSRLSFARCRTQRCRRRRPREEEENGARGRVSTRRTSRICGRFSRRSVAPRI